MQNCTKGLYSIHYSKNVDSDRNQLHQHPNHCIMRSFALKTLHWRLVDCMRNIWSWYTVMYKFLKSIEMCTTIGLHAPQAHVCIPGTRKNGLHTTQGDVHTPSMMWNWVVCIPGTSMHSRNKQSRLCAPQVQSKIRGCLPSSVALCLSVLGILPMTQMITFWSRSKWQAWACSGTHKAACGQHCWHWSKSLWS